MVKAADKSDTKKSSATDSKSDTTKTTKPAKMTSDPKTCPRCRATQIKILTKSPVDGVWTMYQCGTCHYAFRNTEPEQNWNPDKYPEDFRINVDSLSNLFVMPSIPKLRS